MADKHFGLQFLSFFFCRLKFQILAYFLCKTCNPSLPRAQKIQIEILSGPRF